MGSEKSIDSEREPLLRVAFPARAGTRSTIPLCRREENSEALGAGKKCDRGRECRAQKPPCIRMVPPLMKAANEQDWPDPGGTLRKSGCRCPSVLNLPVVVLDTSEQAREIPHRFERHHGMIGRNTFFRQIEKRLHSGSCRRLNSRQAIFNHGAAPRGIPHDPRSMQKETGIRFP